MNIRILLCASLCICVFNITWTCGEASCPHEREPRETPIRESTDSNK